ncbi:MAG TPA: ATP-dependent carboxylate-amine ligase [Lentisphaeria bacterium]|nr:MAG: hypothetical protein A2X48_18270 [Lentisphaerae bacterium GWF2_49_21]HBC87151.1 ATP-dependent carboxylate-amine ligase [Lentisphaeria bacterium]
MKKTSIGISAADSIVGHGIIKSLKKSDLRDSIRIVCFEYFEGTVASQWTEKTYMMPDILKSGVSRESYIEKLISSIKAEDIKILFVAIGFELEMMAASRDLIRKETGCEVIVSSPEVISIAEDKYETFRFLKANGLPYPLTWLPGEIDKAIYPAIVKPRTGTGSKGVYVVNSKDELLKRLSEIKNPVIQENIGTKDDEYTCGVIYLDDEVKTYICLKRYLKFGNTISAYHSKNAPSTIRPYIEKISHALKPFGPCNFQLRIDKDGNPKLFEINARFSGTTSMRPYFGINESEYMVKHLLGMEVPATSLKYGKVQRYQEDLFIQE